MRVCNLFKTREMNSLCCQSEMQNRFGLMIYESLPLRLNCLKMIGSTHLHVTEAASLDADQMHWERINTENREIEKKQKRRKITGTYWFPITSCVPGQGEHHRGLKSIATEFWKFNILAKLLHRWFLTHLWTNLTEIFGGEWLRLLLIKISLRHHQVHESSGWKPGEILTLTTELATQISVYKMVIVLGPLWRYLCTEWAL